MVCIYVLCVNMSDKFFGLSLFKIVKYQELGWLCNVHVLIFRARNICFSITNK